MSKALWFAVLFMLASGAACLGQSDQPSLGDLARKQRDDKKPVKTFTNEDVATTHPEAADSSASSSKQPSSSSSAPADASAKTEAKTDGKKSEPAASSKDTPEIAELKNKLSSYKQEQDGWRRAAKRYQDLLANETDEFRRQMYQDALAGDQNNIQVYQDKIDQAQADLAKAQKDAQSNH